MERLEGVSAVHARDVSYNVRLGGRGDGSPAHGGVGDVEARADGAVGVVRDSLKPLHSLFHMVHIIMTWFILVTCFSPIWTSVMWLFVQV